MESRRIDIAVLRDVFNNIFDFIAGDIQRSGIEIEENLYWTLSHDERFNMSSVPAVERVGSLMDDYQFLLAAQGDKERAVPLLLEHLAPILMLLSERLPSYK